MCVFTQPKQPTASEERTLTQYQTESGTSTFYTRKHSRASYRNFSPFSAFVDQLLSPSHLATRGTASRNPPVCVIKWAAVCTLAEGGFAFVRSNNPPRHTYKKRMKMRERKNTNQQHTARTGELRFTIAEHHTVLKPFVTTELDYEIRSSSSRSFGEWRWTNDSGWQRHMLTPSRRRNLIILSSSELA